MPTETENEIFEQHVKPAIAGDEEDAADEGSQTDETTTPETTHGTSEENTTPVADTAQRQQERQQDDPARVAKDKGKEPTEGTEENTGDPRTDLTPLAPAQRRGLNVFTDAKGNIVDQTGKVIAASGAHARLFNGSIALQEHLADLQRQNTAYDKQIRELASKEVLNNLPKQLNLSDEDARVALQFRAAYTRDPLGTMRNLIANTMKQGYTLNDILGSQEGQQGGAHSINMQALSQVIDERLAPFTQQKEQEAQTQQLQRDAQAAEEELARQYPEVQHNKDTLYRLMETDPRWGKAETIQEARHIMIDAVHKLRTWSAARGFDSSQNLAQQLASMQKQQQIAPQNNQPPVHGRAPLPNGARQSTMSDAAPVQDQNDADADWDTLIKAAFADAQRAQ